MKHRGQDSCGVIQHGCSSAVTCILKNYFFFFFLVGKTHKGLMKTFIYINIYIKMYYTLRLFIVLIQNNNCTYIMNIYFYLIIPIIIIAKDVQHLISNGNSSCFLFCILIYYIFQVNVSLKKTADKCFSVCAIKHSRRMAVHYNNLSFFYIILFSL